MIVSSAPTPCSVTGTLIVSGLLRVYVPLGIMIVTPEGATSSASRSEQSSGVHMPSFVSAVFVTTKTVTAARAGAGPTLPTSATAASICVLSVIRMGARVLQKMTDRYPSGVGDARGGGDRLQCLRYLRGGAADIAVVSAKHRSIHPVQFGTSPDARNGVPLFHRILRHRFLADRDARRAAPICKSRAVHQAGERWCP